MSIRQFLSSMTVCLLSLRVAYAADECQPSTFVPANMKRNVHARQATATGAGLIPTRTGTPKTGELNCRYWLYSPSKVDYSTCYQMAQEYGITIELFFQLNPTMKNDCSNVMTSTPYCVEGYGNCGPNFKNATCQDTDFPCCNSQTWKCGKTSDDCADGTCWGGNCSGYALYAIDGKCGRDNQNRQCAGRWGSCCNFKGACGNGTGFCDDANCQSGNCTNRPGPKPLKARMASLQAMPASNEASTTTGSGSIAISTK